MPLPKGYGVVVGEFLNYQTEQGQWFHVDMNINAGGATYQAAVDVNETELNLQFQILDGPRPKHLRGCLWAP